MSFVIGKKNYTEIVQAAGICRDLGVDELRYRIDFMNVANMRDLSGNIIALINQAKGYSTKDYKVVSVYSEDEILEDDSPFGAGGKKCYNHHFWASIGPDCELYACGHRTHSGVKSYGSVIDHSLKELFFSPERLNAVNTLPDSQCKVCSPSSERRNCFMTFLANHAGVEGVYDLQFRYLDKLQPSKESVFSTFAGTISAPGKR